MHDITNEIGNPLIKQIRARKSMPRLMYYTNGCAVYGKDNRAGGLDVLVLNENYLTQPGGSGVNGASPTEPNHSYISRFTNWFG